MGDYPVLLKVVTLIAGGSGVLIFAYSAYQTKKSLSRKRFLTAGMHLFRALLGGLIGVVFLRVFWIA